MEGRIQGAGFNAQHVLRDLFDPLGDRKAMHGLGG
jgi:hypothetical protein